MKKKRTSGLISIVLTLTVALYPFAWSGTAAAAPAGKDVLVLKAGLLKGTIVDTADRAIAKLPMELLDSDGSTVSKIVTDKSGRFSMSDVAEGGYTLSLGDDYSLKLALKNEAEASEMKVVVPESGGIDPATGFTVTHVFVGGLIVAIVVGVGIAVSDSGSSSSSRVSP